MKLFVDWMSEHSLQALLAVSAIFTFVWLLYFRKRLQLGVATALILSLLHVLIGVLCVSVFAKIESLGNPNATGNMSLFGGVFFMPIIYWIGAKLTKRSVADVFDVFTICLVFTLMCARFSCIITGCCQGAKIPFVGFETLRWPTREAEIVFYIFLLLILGRKVACGKTKGKIYPVYMISYGVFRFITETFRESNSSKSIIHIAHLWALIALCIGISVYIELSRPKKVRQ